MVAVFRKGGCRSSECSPFRSTVKIRRADGSSLDVPRSQVLMDDDEDLIQQLKLILMANNPARDPAYFSTVKNLLRRGAPLQLVAQKRAHKVSN